VRLFAALLLPSRVIEWLAGPVDAARAAAAAGESSDGPHMRWVSRDQWHVTVTFFGEVDDVRLDDLQARLARAASRAPVLDLSLARPGRFGSARRTRVLWLGLHGDTAALRALAASCRAAGRRSGLTTDGLAADARYRPHITLARVTPPGDVSAVTAALDAAMDTAPAAGPADTPEFIGPPSWRAAELVLMRSDLGAGQQGRARHTVLSRFPLGPSTVPAAVPATDGR
jgi:2'-5' RNA ligase